MYDYFSMLSLWDYTNVVMNFLCEPQPQSGSQTLTFDWLKYFDVVITGSAKPGFFHENRANLFEVEPKSGMLLNTDNGTPMVQVGSTSADLPLNTSGKSFKVFQGGNVGHLHKLLAIESSSQVGEQCSLFQSLRKRSICCGKSVEATRFEGVNADEKEMMSLKN
ncbi:hypothetical protein AgCh_013129 [Apium graveolens]